MRPASMTIATRWQKCLPKVVSISYLKPLIDKFLHHFKGFMVLRGLLTLRFYLLLEPIDEHYRAVGDKYESAGVKSILYEVRSQRGWNLSLCGVEFVSFFSK